jgi:hypothetical protein
MPRNDGGWTYGSPGVLAQVDSSISAGTARLLRGSFFPLYLFNYGFNGISLDKFCRRFV